MADKGEIVEAISSVSSKEKHETTPYGRAPSVSLSVSVAFGSHRAAAAAALGPSGHRVTTVGVREGASPSKALNCLPTVRRQTHSCLDITPL
jgi:hypothetical protein